MAKRRAPPFTIIDEQFDRELDDLCARRVLVQDALHEHFESGQTVGAEYERLLVEWFTLVEAFQLQAAPLRSYVVVNGVVVGPLIRTRPRGRPSTPISNSSAKLTALLHDFRMLHLFSTTGAIPKAGRPRQTLSSEIVALAEAAAAQGGHRRVIRIAAREQVARELRLQDPERYHELRKWQSHYESERDLSPASALSLVFQRDDFRVDRRRMNSIARSLYDAVTGRRPT